MIRKTKIVATIGPASSDRGIFKSLVQSGLDVARLNFSHGDRDSHGKTIEMIKSIRDHLGTHTGIMLDTKGPEIRTGKFAGKVYIETGSKFTLTTDDVLGDENICSVSYKSLPADVKIGDSILIDDGLVALEVISTTDNEIITEVKNGGQLSDKKGVNVPSVLLNLPSLTEKDKEDILFGAEMGIDFIAASFIRKAADVLDIRRVLEDNGFGGIHIIAKIENEEGVDNIESIIEVSDGLMVARGDLGVEIRAEQLPMVQKKLIQIANRHGKPVITATQMLDSMIRNPRPTRAETTDVANAIFDGTDSIMLSGETAAGKFPLEAVQTMARIALAAEASIDYRDLLQKKMKLTKEVGVTSALSHSTVSAALELSAAAIITATSSGFTARKVSKLRPKAPIVACTTTDTVCRKLSLVSGVYPIVVEDTVSTDHIFEISLAAARGRGFVEDGDLVVISAGVPVGVAGATNIMKIELVGEVVIKGIGLVKTVVKGRACILDAAEPKEQSPLEFLPGDIIVAKTLDIDSLEKIKEASGMIVEDAGFTSYAAITALNLKKPCLIAAAGATDLIRQGSDITLDSIKGIAYAGSVRRLI